MKKGIYVFLLLCAALSLVFSTSFAQTIGESVLIHPLFYQNGSNIYVTPDQEIILGIGWGACTPGLVRAFISAVQLEWTIDGQPVLANPDVPFYWGEIVESGPDLAGVCIAGNGTIWGSSWRYSLGTLSPGSYSVRFLELIDHPLIDGGDYDGDGKIDRFSGILTDWSVTIVVENPQ